MFEINFAKKISYQRNRSAPISVNNAYGIIKEFESDRGRLINSAAVRRLQQKTQVFPLERHASVRSRLSHSLEVQQVGRYIAKEILNQLKEEDRIDELGLADYQQPFESLVETACLMHDLGNPPFGHFGETAINHWFSHYLADNSKRGFVLLDAVKNQSYLNILRSKIGDDLANFEGNAQTIRLIHSLLKLNLTYSQVACVLKYTRPAYQTSKSPDKFSYLTKKPGYYLAEEQFINLLRKELGMQDYCRYPLTYIMEAADDISYCIADLEDSVEKNILTIDQLYDYLHDEWGSYLENDLFSKIVIGALQSINENDNTHYNSDRDRFFMRLRVDTIANLVPYAAKRFIDNLADIYNGKLNQSLLEDGSEANKLLEVYKKVAVKYVFCHEDVENLELQGYRIINGLLDNYGKLLEMPLVDFESLVQAYSHRDYLIESRLYHKLSNKHRIAYQEKMTELKEKYSGQEYELWEYYYRARLIQDYISGMTDVYAYDEYRKLIVAE